MVFMNVHRSFQSELNTLMNCPFLVCFHDMCPYGLIHRTSSVRTPFSPFFPNILSFAHKGLLRWLRRKVRSSHSSKLEGPHFPREIPQSSLWCYCSFKTSMLFSFSFEYLRLYSLYMALIVLMYGIGKNYYTLFRWLWDDTSVRDYRYPIYLCAIKVEDYVIFQYERSIYSI